jgi:hypothetical protein
MVELRSTKIWQPCSHIRTRFKQLRFLSPRISLQAKQEQIVMKDSGGYCPGVDHLPSARQSFDFSHRHKIRLHIVDNVPMYDLYHRNIATFFIDIPGSTSVIDTNFDFYHLHSLTFFIDKVRPYAQKN